MPSAELERLVTAGLLEHEPPIRGEYDGLIREASATLADSTNPALALESRFRLAYAAAHSIALAALRRSGYRPRNNRQVVFQALAHTLGAPAEIWRTLAKAHEERNRRDYEGSGNIDERLAADIIRVATQLIDQLQRLGPL